MSIVFVQRAQSGNTAASTTLAGAYSGASTAGNLLIGLTTAAGATHNAPTDGSNTWAQAGTTFNIAGGNHASIWYVKNAAAVTNVTMNYGGSYIYRSLVLYEVSGIDTSSPLHDVQAANGFGTTSVTVGPLAFTSPEEIYVSIMIGTQNITPGSGYTGVNFAITGDASKYFMDQYKIVSAAESVTATDGSTGSGILAAGFKVSAGGGGGGKPWYAYAQQRIKVERTWDKSGRLWEPAYSLRKAA